MPIAMLLGPQFELASVPPTPLIAGLSALDVFRESTPVIGLRNSVTSEHWMVGIDRSTPSLRRLIPETYETCDGEGARALAAAGTVQAA